MNDIPGWEGSIGPFPGQYGKPHVYARDVHSGAGNCVCGWSLAAELHVQAAPGVPVPVRPSAGTAPEAAEGALGAQRPVQRAGEASPCACQRQARDDMAAEIADAIDTHREGWASTHPHHAFGEGLDTAARIAREHITQPPTLPPRAED